MQLPDPVELGDLLEPFSRRGIDLGLDRLHQALAAGGHPEQRFPAVQVAGTNGKGSICTALGAILQAAGLKAGLYRSPHLISWCERIAIGDQWIAVNQPFRKLRDVSDRLLDIDLLVTCLRQSSGLHVCLNRMCIIVGKRNLVEHGWIVRKRLSGDAIRDFGKWIFV